MEPKPWPLHIQQLAVLHVIVLSHNSINASALYHTHLSGILNKKHLEI